jgi:hypothetical protein
MSQSRFTATRLNAIQATELWSRSDEATAFTRPENLNVLAEEVDWWGVERSGEVVAAWPLIKAVAGGDIAPPPFCYFVGPMLARSLRASPYPRFWSSYTAIMSAFADALTAEYSSFGFSLPTGLTDVRTFEWWNFDHPGDRGFRIRPRYTAEIELTGFPDDAALRLNFVKNRRQVVDRWTAAPPDVVIDDVSTERLIDLHDQALERSGGVVDDARHTALKRLIALVRSGAGSIIGVVPPGADAVEAAIVVLDGPDESNGVFYAATDGWRNSGLTVWTVWLALVRARSMGKRRFDFNGANSPRRAGDKHSYGAQGRLYFDGAFGQHQ